MKKLLYFLALFCLFGVGVQAEILNETTEKIGDNQMDFYAGKVFHQWNGEWLDFNSLIEWSHSGDSFIASLKDSNKSVEFKPFAWYQGQKAYWSDVPQSVKQKLNISKVLVKERFQSNWGWFVKKIASIDKAGIEVIPNNVSVKLRDYNSLFFNPDTNAFELQERKKFVIGNLIAVKFPHQFDANYSMAFNSNSVTFDGNYEDMEPVSDFISDSQDGHIQETETVPASYSADSSSSTGNLGDTHNISPAPNWRFYVTFNTASLPDNATVTALSLSLQATGLTRTKGFTPSDTRVNYNYAHNKIGSSLNYPDDYGGYTYAGLKDWGTTTGNKTKTAWAVSKDDIVSKTGDTDFELYPRWIHVSATKGFTWIIATSEHTTSSYRPKLSVTYSVPSPPKKEDDFIELIKNQKQKNWNEILSLIFLFTVGSIFVAISKKRGKKQ